ncbi:MAG TPA: hypothetical protein VHZ56_01260 [Devosia sp.]|nr:hypothetical protein [Devosia sp.]
MDRVISLLAALVGLIALGGAILVHTNVDAERQQMASDIAQMRLSIGLMSQQQAPAVAVAEAAPAAPLLAPSSMPPAAASSSAAPEALPVPTPLVAAAAAPAPATASSEDETTVAELQTLRARVSALEEANADQASQLQVAQASLATEATASVAAASAASAVAAEGASVQPAVSTADAAAAVAPAGSAASAVPAAIVADGPTKDCIPLGTRFMAASGDSFPICRTKTVIKVSDVTDGQATIDGAGPVVAGGFGRLGFNGCTVMVFSADPVSGYAEMRVTCD